jgi:S-formylglutathione hydrolase FrmB
VVTPPGRHTWPFAADAFAATLPWLTGELSGGRKRGADDE